MFLEVIGLSTKDIIAIQQAGGQRIELVANMLSEGLSPSEDTIIASLTVAKIPIRVMVRFHNDSFIFTKDEVTAMSRWIKYIRQYPVEGFVIGGLTADGKIDEYMLAKCLDAIDGKACTFHRAFDRVADPFAALQVLQQYRVDTVLTSGGLAKPIINNLEILQQLQANAGNITILAGGGVNWQIIEKLKGSNIAHFHVGSCCRVQGDFSQPIDEESVKQLLY